jgi:hypothetical protein
MEDEFLRDYEQHELEEWNKYAKTTIDGKPSHESIYPPLSRFWKLSKPYAFFCGGNSIYPQIPLYGSLIIPIIPMREKQFGDYHGFNPSQIDALIDFCKETGKIQFALSTQPTDYRELDFLEPIICDLKPPWLLTPRLPNSKLQEKACVEFDTLAGIQFIQWWDQLYRDAGATERAAVGTYESMRDAYALLREKGLTEIATDIENSLVEDPPRAHDLLTVFSTLIFEPSAHPFKAIENYDRAFFASMIRTGANYGFGSKITLPCEIGTFLLENLTFFPESLEACKDVISRYDHRDLHRVMAALSDGACSRNEELVRAKSADLNDAFRMVWEDADDIKRHAELAKFLIPVIIGVMGMILDPSLGLLGSLGFYIAEKTADMRGQSLSQRLAKSIAPSYAATIYDFKKKYGLDRRELF